MPDEPTRPEADDGWMTLQTLGDEVDDALARRDIDVETASRLFELLGKLAAGESDKPVETDGAEYFRGLMRSLFKKPRLHTPDEEQGAA